MTAGCSCTGPNTTTPSTSPSERPPTSLRRSARPRLSRRSPDRRAPARASRGLHQARWRGRRCRRHRRGRPAHLPRGWYVEPTILAKVDNTMRVAQEEIFGPVLSFIAHDGDDDAIRIANDSAFGLAGGVWSGDDDRAFRRGPAGAERFGRRQRLLRSSPASSFRRVQGVGSGWELGTRGPRRVPRGQIDRYPAVADQIAGRSADRARQAPRRRISRLGPKRSTPRSGTAGPNSEPSQSSTLHRRMKLARLLLLPVTKRIGPWVLVNTQWKRKGDANQGVATLTNPSGGPSRLVFRGENSIGRGLANEGLGSYWRPGCVGRCHL